MTAQILIADRNPLLREQCSRYLSAYGYDVAVAADGLQCIEQLRSCSPNLLVLDPGILWGGGLGVLEWLKCEQPAKPVKVVLADGRSMRDIPKVNCEEVAARLERPTDLREMTEFVSDLERILECEDAAVSNASQRLGASNRSN